MDSGRLTIIPSAIFMIGQCIVLPIVIVMLEHQRKMSALVRCGEDSADVHREIKAMREEIAQLRGDLARLMLSLPPSAPRQEAERLEDRIR